MPHALPCAMEFGFLAKVFKIGILKESASEHLLKGMKRHSFVFYRNVFSVIQQSYFMCVYFTSFKY